MEPDRGIEPRLRHYHGRVLTTITRRHELTGLESNQRPSMIQSHVAPAVRATGHQEPPPGADPGLQHFRGRAAAVRGGEAAGQGLEPRFAASEAAVLPLDDPALVGEEGLEPSSGCFWGRPLFRWRTRPQCAASDSNREPPD